MTKQNHSCANTGVLLEEAQIKVRESINVQGGKLHELEPAQWCGRRTLVFDEKEKGTTVAIRSEIPEMSPLRNMSMESPESLTLLGVLTFSLQTQDADVKLISGEQGLEAIMVSHRLCAREIDSATLCHHINRIQDIVQTVEPALSKSGQDLIDYVIEHVQPQISAPTQAELKTNPVIVPTFDEKERNRMMQQVRQ